jgi:Spy/CpxP family protein refolding chaperone
MKTKILVVFLIISLGINIGVFFTVGYHWWREKASKEESRVKCGWHQSPLRQNLNLTSEQISILEKYREEMESQVQPLREELKLKRLGLFNLVKDETSNDKKTDSLLNDIARLQSEIEKKVIQHSIKVKEILGPEQQKKFYDFFEQGLCPSEEHLMPCERSVERR